MDPGEKSILENADLPKDVIRFSDFLASHHCPMAASVGYSPRPPLGNEELGQKILMEWPNYNSLGKIVRRRRNCAQWIGQTRFAMEGEKQSPPSTRETTGLWKNDHIGIAKINHSGDTLLAACHLPYLHKISGVWEVVYCHTKPDPMDTRRRSDLITRIQWDQSVFFHMTGEALYSRLLAPGYQHEERLDVPHAGIKTMLAQHQSLLSASTVRPGLHCSDTYGKNQEYHWRCPVREQEDCSAINAFNGGNKKDQLL